MYIVSPINKRRPVSPKRVKTYRAVERFVFEYSGPVTVKDLARSTKQGKRDVQAALQRLERLGVLKVTGYKHGRKQGRPQRVFERA